MKKVITAAALLAASTALANADAITWTGASGDGLYETAGNWSGNAVPGMEATVIIEGTKDNKISVTQNTRQDWWGMDVTIKNATLTCADSVTKWQTGTITIGEGGQLVIADVGDDMTINPTGTLIINCLAENGIVINDHVKISPSGSGTTINFGLVGSMYVNEIWSNDWNSHIALQLDNGADVENATAYQLVTREFFTLDHNTNPGGGAVNNFTIASSSVTDITSTAMTLVSSADELTADASGMGKYFLSQNADNGSWAVSFVQAIPEPSAFGLLAGVGALALVAARRRRSRKA